MTITVHAPTDAGNTVTLTGDQVGSFILHRSIDPTFTDNADLKFFWCVTHVASGLKFPWQFQTKKAARAFAKAVESALDWSAIKFEIKKDSVSDKARCVSGAPTKEQSAAIHGLADKHGAIK